MLWGGGGGGGREGWVVFVGVCVGGGGGELELSLFNVLNYRSIVEVSVH